ncbi:SusC/RagA family TonB-linked outer membrane protein [Chitinophaga sp. Mgbs1]|uniref:SusC/RagA family TonB-linked outer membrane protein n=1 Tax=Chitinophaga solisilvae TaxID=1233460 RepID=A0A3S1AZR1_9BACT|nr:SusC/RagA family TonB-linked outer membrane protein [Chitinophaga solisilvae]
MRKLSGSSFRMKDMGKLCCLLFTFLLLAAGAKAQDAAQPVLSQKVTYKAQRSPLVRVLKDLRKITKVRLTYNEEHVREQPPVTVNATAMPLDAFLTEILKQTDLTYTMAMGGIVLLKKSVATGTPAKKDEAADLRHVVLRGRVVSPSGQPLDGVSIRAAESGQTTVTQADGMFFIVPRENEIVRFSLLGMQPLTYKAIAKKDGLVIMKMDTVAQVIQEVVINGYQKIDPRLATGSVLKLSATDVIQPGMPTIDKMLQGKVPGLMVVNNSGGVNATPKLRMRGTSTLLGNASPLWVIDGMIRTEPVNISSAILNNVISQTSASNFELLGNAISGVNPYDIESFTFLRDAAATAIYGTRAANGVIVLTTKRGKEGPMRVTYNADFSFQARPSYRNMNLMNSKERILLSRQMQEDNTIFTPTTSGFEDTYSYEGLLQLLYARKISETEFNRRVAILETRNTDWFKELFRNQFSMQHSLSLSGGNARTTYYASLRFSDQKGAAREDGRKNYSATINMRSKITSRLNIDLSVTTSYQQARTYYNSVSPLAFALQTSRIFSPDDFIPIANGHTTTGIYELDAIRPPYTFNIHNEIAHTQKTSSLQSGTVNLNADYKIANGFFFRNNTSFILDAGEGMSWADYYSHAAALQRGWDLAYTPFPIDIEGSKLPVGGIADMNTSSSMALSMRNSFDYSRGLFGNRDQYSITLGNEIRSETGNSRFHVLPGYFPDRGNIFSPSPVGQRLISQNGIDKSKNNTAGVYLSGGYSLMNRYIINGTVRFEGSNRFGQYANANFRPIYSVSGRWNASSENWFPRGWLLNNWQLSASFGTQGNVVTAVGPNLIAQYSTYKVNPANNLPYLTMKSMPYPDLRWEKTYQLNLGTSIGMLNNRLLLVLDYYSKNSVDLVDRLPIPYEYGMDFMYRNGGKMFNRGLELSVTAHLIQRKQSSFSLTFNTSKNLNRVADQVSNYGYNSLFSGEGHPAGKAVSGMYSYIFKGLNGQNGLPQFDRLDLPKPTPNPDDFLVYAGQADPKLTVNITPVITYKSFTLTSGIYLSLGSVKRLNPVINRTNSSSGTPRAISNANRDLLYRWRKPGDEAYTNIPSFADQYNVLLIQVPYSPMNRPVLTSQEKISVSPLDAYDLSDIRTVKNDYLRCNYINVRYNVPPRRLGRSGLQALSVGFSVNNVFTIANPALKGQDPEISGTGAGALPITRQYAGSLNATF